jgi:hypothetical protein
MVVCLTQALTTHRFLGYAALTLAPFAARDMADWLGRARWPGWLLGAPERATLAATACVALAVLALADPGYRFGVRWGHVDYPERACDWIEAHGVRGRALNVFGQGGYLLYRFYPDPGRLPFMDIHQAGTKEIRYLYAWAQQDTAAWRVLDQRFRFDWVLLPGATPGSPRLANFLDADSHVGARVRGRRGRAVAAPQRLVRGPGTGILLPLHPGRPRRHRPAGRTRGARLDPPRPDPRRDRARHRRLSIQCAIAGSSPATWRCSRGASKTPSGTSTRRRGSNRPRSPCATARASRTSTPATSPAPSARSAPRTRHQGAYPEYDLRLGQLLLRAGSATEARRAYERSLARHPDLTDARDSLAALGNAVR